MTNISATKRPIAIGAFLGLLSLSVAVPAPHLAAARRASLSEGTSSSSDVHC